MSVAMQDDGRRTVLNVGETAIGGDASAAHTDAAAEVAGRMPRERSGLEVLAA